MFLVLFWINFYFNSSFSLLALCILQMTTVYYCYYYYSQSH